MKKAGKKTRTRSWPDEDMRRLKKLLTGEIRGSADKQVLLAFSAAKKELQEPRKRRIYARKIIQDLAESDEPIYNFPSLLSQVVLLTGVETVRELIGDRADMLLEPRASLPKIRYDKEYWKKKFIGFFKILDLDRDTVFWVLKLLRRESGAFSPQAALANDFGGISDEPILPVRSIRSDKAWGEDLADEIAKKMGLY
jgi:hypothetical protein